MNYEILKQQIKVLPTTPGVYLFKDATGEILYVGKAANLRHRVASYFSSSRDLSPNMIRVLERMADVEYYVTDSEQEAILLECNLIKKHRPRYNVRLKDDKTYPFLKLTIQEDWPRAYLTRRVSKDGARYFGPFASAGSVHTTLALLGRLFRLRSCREPITRSKSRPCLEYHINRCSGPCIGAISKEDYEKAVNQAIMFLEGKQGKIVKEMRAAMVLAARKMDYEKAASIRDQLQAVEMVIERQKVAAIRGDTDAVAFAQEGDQALALVFFVREGRLVGREPFTLVGTRDESPSRIMTGFVQQFYASSSNVPKRILLQHPLEDTVVIQKWLEDKTGNKVDLRVPRRGSEKELVEMVAENAREYIEQLKIKSVAQPGFVEAGLEELKKILSLSSLPHRIECYDISNIQGTSAVGSMVVFAGGLPEKSAYRRFRIKTVVGADDCAMIREVIRRRFQRALPVSGSKNAWAVMPDLVVIDGGRGQLNAVSQAMKESGVEFIPVVSIAKENEALFLPQSAEPVMLPKESPALRLLQRARDEAHRFALGYHRHVHRRRSFVSALDGIPGVGVRRKRALFRRFGSVAAIRQATLEELKSVEGMTESVARRVKEALCLEPIQHK